LNDEQVSVERPADGIISNAPEHDAGMSASRGSLAIATVTLEH